MNIDELTLGQVKEIKSLIFNEKESSSPYGVGENWFIRTVTHHLVGVIKSVGSQEIVLEGGTVMWIADDGKFSDFFKGNPSNSYESEVYGENDVVLGRGSIIDGTKLGVKIKVETK